MRAWVTDCPNFLSKRNVPMKFRYHSAMMGSLGIGCNILKLSKEDIKLSKELIEEYKKIRPIIKKGIFIGFQVTLRMSTIVFNMLSRKRRCYLFFYLKVSWDMEVLELRLRGLQKDKIYSFNYNGQQLKKTGNYLMKQGIDLRLVGDYDSVIIHFIIQPNNN